jgi:hypothetical protein
VLQHLHGLLRLQQQPWTLLDDAYDSFDVQVKGCAEGLESQLQGIRLIGKDTWLLLYERLEAPRGELQGRTQLLRPLFVIPVGLLREMLLWPLLLACQLLLLVLLLLVCEWLLVRMLSGDTWLLLGWN